jgi:hypothetical protein
MRRQRLGGGANAEVSACAQVPSGRGVAVAKTHEIAGDGSARHWQLLKALLTTKGLLVGQGAEDWGGGLRGSGACDAERTTARKGHLTSTSAATMAPLLMWEPVTDMERTDVTDGRVELAAAVST